MTINISLQDVGDNLHPKITVLGVGGSGGNAVNNMINANLEGVDFLIANTDAQALQISGCPNKIQLGLNSTRGLGAGMRPDIGKQAAEEAIQEITEKLDGSHMLFVAAGMGGGTGTGAAPVIAKLARERGILTVGVVTKPFHFEGSQRMKLAEKGIEELQQYVDTLLTIPNQNLFRIANEKTTFSDAFKMADDVLYAGVRGVTDLMVQPGMINLDFSDVKTVMQPRIGFAFPVSDQTVFHLQYGKFAQMPELDLPYSSPRYMNLVWGGQNYTPDPMGFDLDPIETTQYEVGMSYQFLPSAAIDVTAFAKNTTGQVVIGKNDAVDINNQENTFTNNTLSTLLCNRLDLWDQQDIAQQNGDFHLALALEQSIRSLNAEIRSAMNLRRLHPEACR